MLQKALAAKLSVAAAVFPNPQELRQYSSSQDHDPIAIPIRSCNPWAEGVSTAIFDGEHLRKPDEQNDGFERSSYQQQYIGSQEQVMPKLPPAFPGEVQQE
jgi:hypothetical protein